MILALDLHCVDNATPLRRNWLRIDIFQMIYHCKERMYKETTTVLSEILIFHWNINVMNTIDEKKLQKILKIKWVFLNILQVFYFLYEKVFLTGISFRSVIFLQKLTFPIWFLNSKGDSLNPKILQDFKFLQNILLVNDLYDLYEYWKFAWGKLFSCRNELFWKRSQDKREA